MKKTIVLFLALVIVLSLCACGGKAAPAEGSGSTAPATDAPKASTEEEAKEIAGGTTEAQTAEATSEDDKYGGTFIACSATNPGSLFYPYQYASVSTYVYPAVETLGLRTAKGTYEPWLAESWDIDLEAHTTVLHIRKGVKFHDGSDLNAEVVKWNLDKILEYGNGSVIKNPTAVELVDEYTVKVTFPAFDLNQESFLYSVLIYSKKAFEEHDLDWCLNNVVGTGPFKLQEYVPDSHLTFVRNDNYWIDGLPYLDEYDIQIIPDAAAQMTAFSNGEIHRFQCNNMQISESLFAMGYENKAIIGEPNSSIVYGVYVNNTYEDDPWSDVRVRQALLLYGIDWDAVGYVAGGKLAYQIMSPLIEIGPGYDPTLMDCTSYDVEKAKSMLAEAGYADGFETQILALNYGTVAATEIQAQLKKNFNIDAKVVDLVNGDERRFNGVERGIYLNYGYSTIDFAKHLTSMFNDKGTYKSCMVFSDEYLSMLTDMKNATTIETKSDLISKLSKKLMVDECLFRQMYAIPNVIFLQDYVYDSGMERTVDGITPQTTWLAKDHR